MRRIIILILIGLCSTAFGSGKWSFSVASGADHNLRTRLKIKQSHEQTIVVKHAYYKTFPFESPPFYDLRLGKWDNRTAWELEFMHHKVYLQNGPADTVQNFSISHGYNLLYLNRAWLLKRQFRLHIGGGVVVAHPENEIRYRVLDDGRGGPFGGGYYLAGVTGQVAIGRRFYFSKYIFGLLEGKFLASWARVDVKDGYATVPNLAMYATFGVGLSQL